MSAVYFLRQLFLQKSVSYNLIINEINKLPPFISTLKFEEDTTYEIDDEELSFEENEPIQGLLTKKLTPFTQANNKKMFVLMMFYPEIKESDPRKFKKLMIIVWLSKFVRSIENSMSIEKYKEIRRIGHDDCTVSKLIRDDDIENFQLFKTKTIICL